MNLGHQKINWLQGTRVVLLGHYVPAPLAAYFLCQLGAEVIKVEDGQGDHLRQIGALDAATNGHTSPMFRVLNGGFKSLGLQYRKPEGAALLVKLIQKADLVIDGHRVGALERYLGQDLASLAPHLIYIPITAYGLAGPMRHLAGHDNNILALGGNLSYTQRNENGHPAVFSAPMADIFAGQMAAMAAIAALFGRQNLAAEQVGMQTLDTSMLHAGFFLNVLELAALNDQDPKVPAAGKAWMNGGRADYATYQCSDDRFIFFGLIENWAANRFLREMGIADAELVLMDNDKLGNVLTTMFLQRTQAEWVEIGIRHDACITAVNDLSNAVHAPQIQSTNRIQVVDDLRHGPIQIPSFPMGIGSDSRPITAANAAPLLGEHNVEILSTLLGIPDAEIKDLMLKSILVESTLLQKQDN